MTMGRYYAGPSDGMLSPVVEAVRIIPGVTD